VVDILTKLITDLLKKKKSLEPDDPIPATTDRMRNILSSSDSDCKTFFGFNSQSDLYRLLKCLRLDKDRRRLVERSAVILSPLSLFSRI